MIEPVDSAAKLGLVLSGGGSRAAYQAGVLKGLVEIKPDIKIPILTGLSAGAINVAFLAGEAASMPRAIHRLCKLWSELRTDQVFRSDFATLMMTGIRLIMDLSLGGIYRHTASSSLLKTDPLERLLSEVIQFENIPKNLELGNIEAVSVAATDYGNTESVSFFSSRDHSAMPWTRKRRRSESVNLGVEHIMASSALPILFPPIRVRDSYFGDGVLRNTTPLSPAVHLGAEKLLIVGVRRQRESIERVRLEKEPALGRIMSVVMNAILLDTADMDVERLQRINQTISLLSEEGRQKSQLRPIDFVWITPSEDIGEIAKAHANKLPLILRYLLRGTGTKSEYSEISSYLLFEPEFCTKLIELGYKDCLKRRPDIEKLLN